MSGDGKKKLNLEQAQEHFEELLTSVSGKDVAPFLQWITSSFSTEKEKQKPKEIRDATEKLLEIKHHLVQTVPPGGQLPSEKIDFPKEGYDSDCNATNTVHVDCFLFDEDDVDDLVEKGDIQRNYCVDCNSRNVKSLTFISHSLAPAQLEFAFTKLINLRNMKEPFNVLDIGSRLGPVLYAAKLYGNENVSVTGIEMNEDLCDIQHDVIEKFNLDGINVICSDVRNQKFAVNEADLIIMNNVFSFFMDQQEQESCWQFMHSHIRPNALILHNPKMEDIVEHLDLEFTVERWLEKIPFETKAAEFAGDDENLFEDLTQLCLYRVKNFSHCLKAA